MTDDTASFASRFMSLLDTGSFTTSYKYAVLLALIDTVGEGVDSNGNAPSTIDPRLIGRRVLELYWPQSRPFASAGRLRQGMDGELPEKIADFRRRASLPDRATIDQAKTARGFPALEDHILRTVIRYPLPLLQKFGRGSHAISEPFLFDISWNDGVAVNLDAFDGMIELRDGAARHLLELGPLLRTVIQREWSRFVAAKNLLDSELLDEFLFGADRVSLQPVRDVLEELHEGRCFYCVQPLSGAWEVDHFVPWSRIPENGLDNLVAADNRCNNRKRDALAGVTHLEAWLARNTSARYNEVASTVPWPQRRAQALGAARGQYLHMPTGAKLWRAPNHIEDVDQIALRGLLCAN